MEWRRRKCTTSQKKTHRTPGKPEGRAANKPRRIPGSQYGFCPDARNRQSSKSVYDTPPAFYPRAGRNLRATRNARAVPKSINVPGSGTPVMVPVSPRETVTAPLLTVTPPPVEPPLNSPLPLKAPKQLPPMVSLISVTAPVLAKALPQPSVTLLVMPMLAVARIFPANVLLEPRDAELPTDQYTAASEPKVDTSTTELEAVMSLAGIRKTQPPLALPPVPSSVSVPVKLPPARSAT